MTPLVAFTILVILIFGPLSLFLTRFLWLLHRDDPGNPLNLVMAWQMTTRDVAVGVITVPTILFLLGVPIPWAGQAILIAIDILLISGVIVAGYLWWVRHE